MANGLLSQYQVNPYETPETMTQDQFNKRMTESYTRPKDPNTMYFSPNIVPDQNRKTIMTPYGPRESSPTKVDFFQTGAEIEGKSRGTKLNDKETISNKQKQQSDSTLPDPNLKGKSFMDKLQSGIETIFTMQTRDPERYARMMSGLDLYSRSQTQDLATALLGNNKFNQDQANALMQSNMNAMNYKMSVAKYSEALKKGAEINVDDNETLIAKSFLVGKVDKDNLDSYTAVIATLAKRRSVETGIPYEEILPALFNEMQSSGALKDKSLFSSKLTLDPSKISRSKSIKEVMKAFDMSEKEAIQAIIDEGFTPR
jgi:hypothetical protein|tara:strand:- start:2667 stop:3608 length:942 start_codon:yes stop_codon:yes gene_type:complete